MRRTRKPLDWFIKYGDRLLCPSFAFLQSGFRVRVFHNNSIRKIDATGLTITTVAGTGTRGFGVRRRARRSRPSSRFPAAVTVDGAGNLYIADSSNYRVRQVDSSRDDYHGCGDGSRRTNGESIFGRTAATAVQCLYLSHRRSGGQCGQSSTHRRRREAFARSIPSGTITTVAGIRDYGGYRVDGGPASWAFAHSIQPP